MNSEKIFNALNQIKISIDQHKDEIEKLDQEIGDGDHISVSYTHLTLPTTPYV